MPDEGARIAGGPIPRTQGATAGYYGQPVVKPPVWTWQVGLYLFVGGTAGMAGVIALAAFLTGGYSIDLVRAALGLAAAGSVIAPALLIADLGRPKRFLYMLRVFKWRSPMSMGVWILMFFGSCAVPAFLLAEGIGPLTRYGVPESLQRGVLFLLLLGVACLACCSQRTPAFCWVQQLFPPGSRTTDSCLSTLESWASVRL